MQTLLITFCLSESKNFPLVPFLSGNSHAYALKDTRVHRAGFLSNAQDQREIAGLSFDSAHRQSESSLGFPSPHLCSGRMVLRDPGPTFLSPCVELILNPPIQGNRGNLCAPSASPPATSFQHFPQQKVHENITANLLKGEHVTESQHAPLPAAEWVVDVTV